MKPHILDHEHSEVGPSGIGSIILCPGKVRLSRGLDDVTSFAAAQGTVAHKIGEQRLLNKPGYKAGEVVEQEGHSITVDAEMLAAVDVYVDHINKIRDTHENKYTSEGVEQSGDLSFLDLPKVFGTADYVLSIHFDTLYVRDYKHGLGVDVQAEGNPQLMSYALIAGQDAINTYQTIDMGIVQPRVMGEKIKTWKIKTSELMNWAENVLKPSVTMALSDDAPLNPGKKQCMWCRAKSICPAMAKVVIETAQKDFKDFKTIDPYNPDTLTDKQVESIYPKLGLLSDWIKAIESRVFNTLSAGLPVEGYKLVTGRKSRDWSDPDKVERALIALDIDPYEKKLLTPAKAEKALGKDKRRIEKLIIAKKGKPTIVRTDDKRTAITTAQNDFEQFKN